MMHKDRKDYFIIVNFNSGADIVSCVHSIITSQKIRPHIVIVDNASRDQSLEECKNRFPNAVYIYNTHNIGFAAAANVGMRYALERGATTLTLCNPDAILAPDCASQLIATINSHKAAIVSPLIYKGTSTNIWFSGGKIDFRSFRTIHTYLELNTEKKFFETSFVSGCIMTIDAKICRDVGLFDERFFLYYEDADLCYRAIKKNYTLGIVPSACGYHKEISERDSDRKTYFLVLSGLLFFDKHTKGFRRILFKTHLALRKIKNYFDRKKNKPLSISVQRAFEDYERSHI
jgi:GT2 family glycosyltransferase